MRRVVGGPHGAGRALADVAPSLPKLFVLRPNDGLGKEFLFSVERLEEKIQRSSSEAETQTAADELYRISERFSDIQREQVETMMDDVAGSAEELLKKLACHVDVQTERVVEIEKVRSSITAAQSAETLDGMRSMLNKSMEGLQTIVETELKRQREIRSDHEIYTARLQQKLETAEKESRTDSLTGIPNRHGCMKKIASVLDYVKTNRADYRLALIDLNGFKQINDTLGHAAGDAALIEFTRRLTAAVGKDAFVGRLGGDEFIVISNYTLSTLTSMLQRLQEQLLSLPATYKGISLELSFCYGVSQINRSSDSTSILEQADMVLYKNKNNFYESGAA